MYIYKKVHLIILFLIVLFLIPLSASAQRFKVKVIIEEANLHLRPDAKSPIISAAPKGTMLETDDVVADWLKVSLPPDDYGYVIIAYIKKEEVEIIKELSLVTPGLFSIG